MEEKNTTLEFSDYKIPESLKQYFNDSKTIKEKLSTPILESIEDNYVRLCNFYDFNESEFGEIVVDCLGRFKAEETFGWFLNQKLKESMDMNIKGTKVRLEKISELLDENFDFAINKLLDSINHFRKSDEFNYNHQQDFETYYHLCHFIIHVKEKSELNFQDMKNEIEDIKLSGIRKEIFDKRFKHEEKQINTIDNLVSGINQLFDQLNEYKEKATSKK